MRFGYLEYSKSADFLWKRPSDAISTQYSKRGVGGFYVGSSHDL